MDVRLFYAKYGRAVFVESLAYQTGSYIQDKRTEKFV